ncbi:MAG: hypothetical protein ACREOU_10875 [Candidatus Eiseniibacteriota bacterium]
MKHLRELVGRELTWTQPHALKRDFDLMDGSAVVATLRFRSLMGSLGVAETADGTWTFKRVGFWQTRVTIRDSKDREIATFRNNTWTHGGTLELADGRELTRGGRAKWTRGSRSRVRFSSSRRTAGINSDSRIGRA